MAEQKCIKKRPFYDLSKQQLLTLVPKIQDSSIYNSKTGKKDTIVY